jgi:serine/threonine protein phosphatase PrpC
LTKDHTVVQKMVDAGMLTLEEAAKHPNASVLERAVGSKPDVEVEVSPELKIYDGDAVLLCSDGLSGYASDAEITAVLRSPATVQEVPQRLVELALQKGGEDNVTVQFIQCGTRKEAATVSERTKKLPVMKPPKAESSLLKTVVFLLLFGAICAGLFLYLKIKLADTEAQLAAVQKFRQGTTQNLREKLRVSANQIDNLRTRLAEQKKTSESSAGKLAEELEKTKVSKNNAASRARKLQNNLNTTTAAKEKAEKLVKELEQKLRVANAKIEEVQKTTETLQTQLDDATQEIAELKAKRAQVNDATENKQPPDQKE